MLSGGGDDTSQFMGLGAVKSGAALMLTRIVYIAKLSIIVKCEVRKSMNQCEHEQPGHGEGPWQPLHQELRRVLHALVFVELPPGELAQLPPSQHRCLVMVRKHPDLKMADVAERMGIKLSALSQVVTRLVRQGLLTRETDPEDRRVVHLLPTPQAVDLLETEREARRARIRRACEQLAPEERAKVLEGLRLLAEAAERADGGAHRWAPEPVIVKMPIADL